jgi:hypothetical protein
MTARVDLRRRTLLRSVVVAALVAAIPAAWGQDPKNAIVQKEARAWLALADRDDGPASWKAAGQKFQAAMSAEEWTQALLSVRKPIGKAIQRAMTSTTFDSTFPGAPKEGTYAHVEFRTAFANRTEGGETITLEREADGAWRVIGYSIH